MKKLIRRAGISLSFLLICSFLLCGHNPVFAEQPLSAGEFAKVIVCSKVFEALGRLDNQAAKEVLVKGLRSNHYLLRLAAVNALSELQSKEAMPELRVAADDGNYLVRIAVLGALVKFGDTDRETALLSFLNDSNPAVRNACVATLRSNFGSRYAPQLLKVLEGEKSTAVRREIIDTLGDNRFEAAAAYISTALKDPDPEIRQVSCRAIYKIINREDAIALLKDCLKDNNPLVRAEAKISLGQLNEASLFNQFWKDLQDSEPVIRSSSFEALANLKSLSVIPTLLKAIVAKDSPAFVRMGAARSLKILKPSLNQEVSKSWSKTESQLAENIDVGYRVEGKNLLSLLTEALRNNQDPLYRDAPLILKELGDSLTYPALRKALYQDNPEIVASVAYVLGILRDKDAFSDLVQVCKAYGF